MLDKLLTCPKTISSTPASKANPEATELVNESGSGNIQLLRPNSAEPHIKLSASRLSYYNVPATTSTKTPKIPEHRQQRPAV